MPVGLRWYRDAGGRIHTRRDRETGETVAVTAPVYWGADFAEGVGTAAASVNPHVSGLTAADSATITVLDQTTNSDTDFHGAMRHVSGTGNAATASHSGFSLADVERINLGATTTSKYNSFECRVKIKKNSDLKYQNLFLGFVGGTNIPAAGTGLRNTCQTIVGFFIGDISGTAWLPGNVDSLGITAVTVDGSNATASSCTATTDSAGTAVDDTVAIYRFDIQSDKTVRFYINNVRVCSGTTFSLASILAAYNNVQVLVCLHRTASAVTASQSLATTDYFRVWGIR